MKINEKFIKKYLRLAKHIGEDENPCYSRQIGAVIVNPITNKVKATGYNGSAAKTPHADAPEYLRDVVWTQLTEQEKKNAEEKTTIYDNFGIEEFVDAFGNSKMCPRKVIGAKSGERMELCPAVHAEVNAIINASEDLHGCWMFCWCGVPCWECSKVIINAGIKKVICIGKEPIDYSPHSRWLFKQANVELEIRNEETLENVSNEKSKKMMPFGASGNILKEFWD